MAFSRILSVIVYCRGIQGTCTSIDLKIRNIVCISQLLYWREICIFQCHFYSIAMKTRLLFYVAHA